MDDEPVPRYFVTALARGLEILRYAAVRGMQPTEIALPYMRRLSESVGGSSTLSKRQGIEMISVERVDGSFVRLNRAIGSRAPLSLMSSGLAILAALPESARREAMAEMEKDDPAWDRHRQRIDSACRDYAQYGVVRLTHPVEGQYTAIAVPLFEDGIDPAEQWALSCGEVAERWPESHIEKAAEALRETRAILLPALATFL